MRDDYGWSGSLASVRMLRLLLLSLSVGRQSVSATVTAVSEPSVSAVVSVTAITGLQIRRHLRLRPKPEESVFGRSLVHVYRKMHASPDPSAKPTEPRMIVEYFRLAVRV